MSDLQIKPFIRFARIQGSSILERDFSTAGNLVSDQHRRLLPQNVEKMMFIKMNYQFLEEDLSWQLHPKNTEAPAMVDSRGDNLILCEVEDVHTDGGVELDDDDDDDDDDDNGYILSMWSQFMTFQFNPKLGIDNPALCLGEDPGLAPEPATRTCVLRKDANGLFGFHLHMGGRDGHVVSHVVPGGPAHLGGLKDGDQLLQINGEYVHKQEHIRVVEKINSCDSRISLTVLDKNSYEKLRTDNVSPLSVLTNCLPESCPRPQLCLIRNEGRGFGFTASATGGVRGTFLLTVEDGGSAQKAGVPQGARLLDVNGENIMSFTLSQLTKKLQQNTSCVVLLVLESSALGVYESHGVTPSIALADTSSLLYKTRKLHLVRGPQGYGFLLRQEKCLGGHGQFLRELDPGLPAEDSGMREGDRLLAVNGQSVKGMEHEDIVSLIQNSGNQVTLLVISNEGDRFYSEIGVSPLLFYEDKVCHKNSADVMGDLSASNTIQVEESLSQPETEKGNTVVQSSEE
ncbi:Na(+)/H(+) exchange regulatory cofactor NHE-RF4 [Pseudophryne corroboree]|uniref:Na(+)/H(+) exchange regulatory cofactor NHE-RF4 n=1 Tax=Pseudophryne corroboree TaxID=495146 RepID=UPI0030817658